MSSRIPSGAGVFKRPPPVPRHIVRAGKFRQSVDIYKEISAEANPAVDSFGQPTGSDTLISSGVRCHIEPIYSTDFLLAQQEESRRVYRVAMRHFDAIDDLGAEHYLLYKGRRLNVLGAINVDSLDKVIVAICVEDD